MKGGVKMASFRKRGSTWQYRIKHKDPLTHEQIEVSKGGFKTKKEAQLAARQEEIYVFFLTVPCLYSVSQSLR